MAELHIIGQIISAQGYPDNNLSCRWTLQFGGWRLLGGLLEGQTHTDSPGVGEVAYLCHPIDIHMSTRTVQGWPKIQLQVWHLDDFGRQEICGYGMCFVPTVPGEHDVECSTWRPSGSVREEVMQKFLGGGLQLRNANLAMNSVDRYKLTTVAMGTVKLRLGIIMRNFDKFGIECN